MNTSNKLVGKKESLDYLLIEYQQCFEHMRHHNQISISLAKFIYVILAAIGSGAFALFKYLEGETYQYAVVGSTILFALVIGLVFSALMVRNRKYFIVVAQQVNSIRHYFLKEMELDFSKWNKCKYSPDTPKALNWRSSYCLLILIISIVNGLLGGLGYYFVVNYFQMTGFWSGVIFSVIIGIVISLSQIASIFYSLHKQDI